MLLEFTKIALATACGFALMGFIGFFVKLIHIPINNLLVYVLILYKFELMAFKFNFFLVLNRRKLQTQH